MPWSVVQHLAEIVRRLNARRSVAAAFGARLPRGWAGPSHTDAGHRDCVLIGTAAGLAAAFSTPIGGLLLAIEQVSHHTIPAREPAGDVTSTL